MNFIIGNRNAIITSVMGKGTILLVDDEADNRRVYGDLLELQGFSVRRASSAAEALASALESTPDLVLSDVAMAGGDGITLLARLRAERATASVPVILMSGVRNKSGDQTRGLELGADDYLSKPIEPPLLAAKVSAVLRRSAGTLSIEILRAQGLEVDLNGRIVKSGGRPIELTRKEFDLLATFMRRPGRVLSTSFLLETVWGYDTETYSNPHTVGVHVSTLRKKIGAKAAERIVSVPGFGYRFEA